MKKLGILLLLCGLPLCGQKRTSNSSKVYPITLTVLQVGGAELESAIMTDTRCKAVEKGGSNQQAQNGDCKAITTGSAPIVPPLERAFMGGTPIRMSADGSDQNHYLIGCIQLVRNSKCIPLVPGVYMARIENGHFFVQDPGNAKKEIQYEVIAASRIPPPK